MFLITLDRIVVRSTLLAAALALAVGSAQAAYRKVSNSGQLLPDTAVLGTGLDDWACTYDDAMQLLWEVKTSDGGLRDFNKTYTNYDDPTQDQVMGQLFGQYTPPTQAQIDAPTNSIGFVNAVNAQGLCGFHNWRRPTADRSSSNPADHELHMLWDPTHTPPDAMIDAFFFPNTYPNTYLSSSPGPLPLPAPPSTWAIHFGNSGNGLVYSARSANVYLRLVRSAQLFPVAISITGTGAGAVTGGTGDCTRNGGVTSGTCMTSGDVTNTRTLIAVPVAGSVFTGWSGCDSLTADTPPQCMVTTNAAKTVTANFTALSEIKVQTAGTGSGTVTGSAIDCTRTGAGATTGTCTTTPVSSAPITLTASPAAGSNFSGWSGCDSQTTDMPPKCVVSGDAAKTVTATFSLTPATSGSVAAVPTLGQWSLMLLSLLAAGMGAGAMRRR